MMTGLARMGGIRGWISDQFALACNEALAAHPLYLRDADDDFDSTYATFWFRCPAVDAEVRAALAAARHRAG